MKKLDMRIQRPRNEANKGLSRDPTTLLFVVCLFIPFCLHLLWRYLFVSSETGDRLTWIGVLLFVAVMGVMADRARLKQVNLRTTKGSLLPIATVFFFASLASLHVFNDLAKRRWFGFGRTGALCFLLCSLLLYHWHANNLNTQGDEYVTVNRSSATKVRELVLLGISACASVFFYGAFLIQPSWGVVDRFHSRYVINEIVGPLAGNWGVGNHIPQYTSGLGIPLLILRAFELTTAQIYAIASVYISGLALLTGSLIFMLSWKLSVTSVRPIMPFFTLGLAFAAQARPIEHWGSITALMSAVPGRMLPVLLVFACLFSFGKTASAWTASMVGAGVGFCLINNFEFGVSTAISALLGIVALRTSLRHLVIVAMVVVFEAGCYLAMVALDGNSLNVSSWTLFSLGFGSGFGNVAMPRFGVWIPVLAVLAFAAVLSIRRIRCIRMNGAEDRWSLRPVYLLVLVASSNGLLQFGYYAGRSVNSGQLQILLIYLALVSAGLSHEVFRPGRGSTGSRWVFAMMVALPGLALPSTRWPLSEWQRVTGHSRSVILESEDTGLMRESDLIAGMLEGRDREGFVLLLEGANLHSIGSGVVSVAPTNSPRDYRISKQIGDRICEAIEEEDRLVITSSGSGLDRASPAWCGAFPITAGVPPSLVVLSNLTSDLP